MSYGGKRRRWPWILVLVILIAGGGVLFSKSRARAAPLDPALVLTAKRAPLVLEILETGKVFPREKVELKSKVAGQVTEVRVKEGEQVKKGAVLLVLDPSDYQREVARAEAEVAQAKNSIDLATLTLARTTRAVAANVASTSETEQHAHDLTAKNVALRIAEVSLGTAQDRVRYTRMLAPMNGTVIQRAIEPGEVVIPGIQSTFDGKPLLTIADLSTLLVRVNLNQIDVAKVSIGRKAILTLDALPGKTYEATITKVAPASVKTVGKDLETFPVEALLATTDGLIKPGMTADVRIILDTKPGVIALPLEAVTKEGAQSFVTRVTDGADGATKTDKVEVTVGARNDRDVEIVKGLNEGDRVLVKPAPATENETKL